MLTIVDSDANWPSIPLLATDRLCFCICIQFSSSPNSHWMSWMKCVSVTRFYYSSEFLIPTPRLIQTRLSTTSILLIFPFGCCIVVNYRGKRLMSQPVLLTPSSFQWNGQQFRVGDYVLVNSGDKHRYWLRMKTHHTTLTAIQYTSSTRQISITPCKMKLLHLQKLTPPTSTS